MFQEALAIGFESELTLLNASNSYFKRLPLDMQQKRDRMAALLKKMGLIPIIPDGAYFMLADFSKIGKVNNSLNFNTKCFFYCIRTPCRRQERSYKRFCICSMDV